MKLFDISPTISQDTDVFPGDTPFSLETLLDYSKGDHLKLSSMHTTLHIGAHADATNHYDPNGQGIDQRPLRAYLGQAQLIDVQLPRGERIYPHHIAGQAITSRRILFRTNSFPDPNQWNADFNSLSPELIRDLAAKGVILVGIDTPSVDPETSKDLESHQALYQTEMAVLEGLVLTDVPVGTYILIAPPLKLAGADAAPVRAILIQEPDWT